MNITKSLWVACAVSVLSAAPLGSAFAQREQPQQQQQQQQQQRRQDQREPERGQNRGSEQRGDSHNSRDGRDRRQGTDQNGQQRPDNRQNYNGGYNGSYKGDNNGRYGNRGRGAGPDHNFYVGSRLPPVYRQRTYVVDDWRGHQLRTPPRGYHWVQNGGDYLLVAIATGVILELILNN